MAFIKIRNVVLNTTYIAAVKLDCRIQSGEPGVSILLATPKFSLSQVLLEETTTSGFYHYEWLDFTGKEARALQDYFSSFNNVVDLLPVESTVPVS